MEDTVKYNFIMQQIVFVLCYIEYILVISTLRTFMQIHIFAETAEKNVT